MATQNEVKLADVWRALDENSAKCGWNTIPIAARSNLLLFAGRHHPQNQESMLIGFTVAALPKQSSLPQSKGFTLEAIELPYQGVRYFCLAITRQSSASIDIFSAMLDDIVMVLERSGRTEQEHIATVIERISGWQRFMSREDDGILTAEAELGLLGELQVLRSLITAGISAAKAVDWWRGPTDSLHDFVCPLGDIEVKSSTRNGSFSANVAPLDQLDESLVQSLYLAAVQFSLSTSGLRLPQHIDSLRLLLSADQEVVASLDGKLLTAGYHKALASRYQRQFLYLLTSFYEVNGEFPRLSKGSVRAGVIEARYRIEIDSTKFRTLPLDEILQRIG
jgi:hypothetical protein